MASTSAFPSLPNRDQATVNHSNRGNNGIQIQGVRESNSLRLHSNLNVNQSSGSGSRGRYGRKNGNQGLRFSAPINPVPRDPNAVPWTSFFGGGNVSSSVFVDLPSIEHEIVDGLPQAPANVVAKGIEIWNEYIVGFFIEQRIAFPAVKKFLKEKWKLRGSFEIATDRDLFYFHFTNSEDKKTVLDSGPIFIAGRLFIMLPWSEEVERKRQQINIMPIWMNVYGVPKQMWTSEGLAFIAGLVGKPKFMDELTSRHERLNFARVCVEIGVDTKIEKVKSFRVGNKVETVHIEYPWLPSVCANCSRFGHITSKCSYAVNTTWVPTENVAVRQENLASASENGGDVDTLHGAPIIAEADVLVNENGGDVNNLPVAPLAAEADADPIVAEAVVLVNYNGNGNGEQRVDNDAGDKDFTMAGSATGQHEASTMNCQTVNSTVEVSGNINVLEHDAVAADKECPLGDIVTDQLEDSNVGSESANQVAMQCLMESGNMPSTLGRNHDYDSTVLSNGNQHQRVTVMAPQVSGRNSNQSCSITAEGVNTVQQQQVGNAASIEDQRGEQSLQRLTQRNTNCQNIRVGRSEDMGAGVTATIMQNEIEIRFQDSSPLQKEGTVGIQGDQSVQGEENGMRIRVQNDHVAFTDGPPQDGTTGVVVHTSENAAEMHTPRPIELRNSFILLGENDVIPESLAGIMGQVDMVTRRMDQFLSANKATSSTSVPSTSKNLNSAKGFSVGPRRSQRRR